MIALVINIMVQGSILLLIALGLTLIFGLGNIVNFAHGALYSLGALFSAWLLARGVSFYVGVALTIAAGVALGIILEYGIIKWIRRREVIDSLLLTFGLAILLTGVMYQIWGPTTQRFSPPSLLAGTMRLGPVSYPSYRVAAAVTALVIVGGLFVALMKTRWGLHVRATNDDKGMAGAIGINSSLMVLSVFAVGSGLATLAGALGTPIFGASPTVGDAIILQAFLVIVIGGLGSLRGAIIGAYVVSAVVLTSQTYIGGQVGMMLLFGAVALVLLKLPRGILKEGRVE